MKKHLINVPYINQSLNYPTGCESVSSVMLLRHLGYQVTVDEWIENYLECQEFETRDGIVYGGDPRKVFCGSPYREDGMGCTKIGSFAFQVFTLNLICILFFLLSIFFILLVSLFILFHLRFDFLNLTFELCFQQSIQVWFIILEIWIIACFFSFEIMSYSPFNFKRPTLRNGRSVLSLSVGSFHTFKV